MDGSPCFLCKGCNSRNAEPTKKNSILEENGSYGASSKCRESWADLMVVFDAGNGVLKICVTLPLKLEPVERASHIKMEEHDAGWEDLRRDARKLEGDLDMKLSSYAKLGGMLAHGGRMEKGSASDVLGGDGSWKSMEMEIESLLGKLVDVNDSMSHCAVAAAPTTSVTQKLARHRDILHEYTQEFKRTRGNINSLREHAELLTSVRNEYKASGSSSPGPSLLRERAAIHGNINQIEEVIIQAHSTKGALSTQRSMFVEIQGKVKSLSDRFPIIRSVLGAIRRKRSRDTLILSAVIAACTLFLFIYWLFK